jgi:hypothetical protein
MVNAGVGEEGSMTTEATASTVRSADGTSIAFERPERDRR